MGRVSESAGLGKRDNDCFGSGIEDFQIHEEFDFEKNLALFDKVMNIFLQRTLNIPIYGYVFCFLILLH